MAKPLLATATDLATLTGRPEADTRLALALKRASARFYGDTHRESILKGQSVERHNGTGGASLLLRGAPVLRVVSVVVDEVPLLPTDYRIDYDNGILERAGGQSWPTGLGRIVVDYEHGFEEVPGDIEDAVLEHAATIASILIHLQQEGGGATQASYAKEATVGTTAKWVATVARYDLDSRS